MKCLIVALSLTVIAVSVYSETCTTVQDCVVTGCSSGGQLVCDDEGKCTCMTSHTCTDGENVGVSCRSARTCKQWYDSTSDHNCECADTHNLHCIDGQCKCGYPPNC